MYDYRGKVAGMIISALSIIAMVAEHMHPFLLNQRWNEQQQHGIFVWLTLFGLFLMMYSKERVDDERTKQIRLKSIQVAFMLMVSTMSAFGLTMNLAGEQVDAQLLYFFPAMGVVLYLLMFHVGLYFDQVWEYEDKGLISNLRNIPANKWGILAYFVICGFLLLILSIM
jgi:hypothetical protein